MKPTSIKTIKMTSDEQRQIVLQIAVIAARFYGARLSEVLKPNRREKTVLARRSAVHFSYRLPGMSHEKIGMILGVSACCVREGIAKVAVQIDADYVFRVEIGTLEQQIVKEIPSLSGVLNRHLVTASAA